MPGITHWQSPHFHAYFPANVSYPSMLADLLSDAIGCIGFSWICSPACTELETVMLDWLGRAIDLPNKAWRRARRPIHRGRADRVRRTVPGR